MVNGEADAASLSDAKRKLSVADHSFGIPLIFGTYSSYIRYNSWDVRSIRVCA